MLWRYLCSASAWVGLTRSEKKSKRHEDECDQEVIAIPRALPPADPEFLANGRLTASAGVRSPRGRAQTGGRK